MNAKKTILAVLAGTAMLGVAAGAQAHDGWRNHNHGYYGNGYRHYAPRVVVRATPVYYGPRYYAPTYYDPYYAPAPAYYAPPPAYYAPAPAIYGRIPLGHRSSLGFSLPLY